MVRASGDLVPVVAFCEAPSGDRPASGWSCGYLASMVGDGCCKCNDMMPPRLGIRSSVSINEGERRTWRQRMRTSWCPAARITSALITGLAVLVAFMIREIGDDENGDQSTTVVVASFAVMVAIMLVGLAIGYAIDRRQRR